MPKIDRYAAPYFTTDMRNMLHAHVDEVLASGVVSGGVYLHKFEEQLQKTLYNPNVIAVSSGTAALTLALASFNVGRDDIVVVPSITFAATANAALTLGCKVIFADCDADTGLIDVESVKTIAQTNRVKAIIGVHLRGDLCDSVSLRDLCQKTGSILIEDAAHTFGSIGVGSGDQLCDAACFSFDPIKNITTGEGGAIAFKNSVTCEYAKELRNNGTYKIAPHTNVVAHTGYNFKMPELSAAMGLVQLSELSQMKQKKLALYADYMNELKIWPIYGDIHYHLFCIEVPRTVNKVELRRKLRAKGIATQVHYNPLHLEPAYSKYTSPCPHAVDYWKSTLSLPFHCNMTTDDVKFVCDSIKEIIGA